MTDRVHFLQGVPNDLLPAIYSQAEAFIYPSRYEGFGVPIIEAIQSGLPVVAATGSCLEEAGGPDCLYIDPDDADGAASALLSAIEKRTQMVGKSRQYVKRFENQDVASQVIKSYEKVGKAIKDKREYAIVALSLLVIYHFIFILHAFRLLLALVLYCFYTCLFILSRLDN